MLVPRCSMVAIVRSRRAQLALAAICLVAVAAGLSAYRHRHRYRHFAIHDSQRVYRSAWVDDDVLAELIPQYGIRTVINLCYPGEMGDRNLSERTTVERLGAKFIELPFPPNNTWHVDDHAVTEIEKIFDDPRSYPLWIHCQHGEERTAKALAIYDIRRRAMTAGDSLAKMARFGDPHPGPVVAFAHNYESQLERQGASCCRVTTDSARR